MTTAALDRQRLKLIGPQPQPPCLSQQRRKVRRGSELGGQSERFHRGAKMTPTGGKVKRFPAIPSRTSPRMITFFLFPLQVWPLNSVNVTRVRPATVLFAGQSAD